MKTPATPTATAARARAGTNSRSPPEAVPWPPGLLHRMGGVEDHGRAGGSREDRQRAHVGDERVVAEGDATLRHQHIAVASARHFGDDVGHIPGRQELALLDVDHAAGCGGGGEEIGLPAEEGRDLKHVYDFGDARALLGFVHVRQNRHGERLAQFGKNRQGGVEADATIAPGTGTIGLVERCLVDKTDPQPAGDLLERGRHFERVVAAFERTRPCDQNKRQRIPEARFADGDDWIGSRLGVHGGRTMRRSFSGVNRRARMGKLAGDVGRTDGAIVAERRQHGQGLRDRA